MSRLTQKTGFLLLELGLRMLILTLPAGITLVRAFHQDIIRVAGILWIFFNHFLAFVIICAFAFEKYRNNNLNFKVTLTLNIQDDESIQY